MIEKQSQNLVIGNSALPNYGFMRLPQVLEIYPVGKSTWWAGVKDGRFPQPVKLSPRTTAWKVQDIQELINTIN